MDTKWKRSKKAAGMIAYVVGISLMLFALLFNPYLVFSGERADLPVIANSEGTYEQTQDFRDNVSDIMNNLIRISAGQPLSYTTHEYAYEQDFGEGLFSFGNFETDNFGAVFYETTSTDLVASEVTIEEPEEVVEEAADSEAASETAPGGYAQKLPEANDAGQAGESRLSEEETETMLQDFLQYHKEDQNLLFEVIQANGRSYGNAGSDVIGGEQNRLPEQYSLLMKFDGEKVTAYLEGEELDIYGDGIYKADGTQWAVPGYENYKIPEDWKTGAVTLAVRRVPVLYTVNDTVYGRSLYRIYHSFASRQWLFTIWAGIAACAVLALGAAWLFRKPCREMRRQIGEGMGKIPFEITLALFAGLAFLIYMMLVLANTYFWEYFRSDLGWICIYGTAMLCFWGIRILWLDLRYGKKPWKNSLIGRIFSFLNKREWELSVQEKIAGRTYRPIYFLAGGLVLLVIGCVAGFGFGMDLGAYLTAAAVLAFAVMVVLLGYNEYRQWKLAADLGHLNDQINAAYEGKMRQAYELPADSDLAEMAKKVAGIQDGLEKAVEERMKSERMKVELVANVSHDIKTPLTSIISYVDLLKEDENLPEELKDYVAILSQKSERLKEMVQDVFEVSRATSGQLPVKKEKLDLSKLLLQTLADMQEQIDSAPVSLKVQIPEEAVEISADGQRLYRVFQNLLTNALKYSLEGSRVYINLEIKGSLAVASVRNTSRDELNGNVDFTERFVRGDASRTDGGSGLGLSIAKSFTEACGGNFSIEMIADLFVAKVEFPVEGP